KRFSVTEQRQYSTEKFDFQGIATHLYGEGASFYGEGLARMDYRKFAYTLCRRLKYFTIKFIDYDTELTSIEEAVCMEMDGLGRLLGYRAPQKKLRDVHGLMVPINFFYGMIEDVWTLLDWRKEASWEIETP
ncbi:Hypothetical predicted protein, partial [Paramuricea clavata]